MSYGDQDNSKVYVGNLSFQTHEDELKETFCEYGPISDHVIVKDRNTGYSRGFGFVTFERASDAQRAVEALDGSELGGRNIKVNIARPQGSGGGGRGRGRRDGYGYGGRGYNYGY
ncbi:glycine-rich RNA-binding protein-like [Acanthaster planci]|uniref:Glycine-rich RNA-binding protein-like n=1 Tax=Acanthaster planci TaxID=133434 RepID=A0A8B7YQM2_ACAPL|nr:glycine-rich RNA-binding protein-like [Acanthaster planci]